MNFQKMSISFDTDTIVLFSLIILFITIFFGTSIPFSERNFEAYESETSNPINQVVFIFLFLTFIYVYLNHYILITKFISFNFHLGLVIILSLVSFIWSEYPLISFKRSFQLLVTFLTIVNSVLWISHKSILKILLAICLSYSFLTYISGITLSDAIDPAFGTWRGIELSKNGLGYTSLMILVVGFLINQESERKIKNAGRILIIFASGMIILANSTTNIIGMIQIMLMQVNKLYKTIFKKASLNRLD